GGVDAGVAIMREGAELFKAVGQPVGLAHRARLAEGLLRKRAVGEASDVIASALEQGRATGDLAFGAALLALRGEALAYGGEMAAAARSFSDAIELANRQGAILFALRAADGLRRLENAR